jgi:hypothetical protein
MVILPYIDVLETCFSQGSYAKNKLVNDVIYNEDVKVCFSKKYLELLEASISNKDALQSLVIELSDKGRIKVIAGGSKNLLDEEFTAIVNSDTTPLLIPFIFENNLFSSQVSRATIVKSINHLNLHWLTSQLMTKKTFSLSYLDFQNDDAIYNFFDTIFLVPKYIREVFVFDREQTFNFLEKVKGRNISYYTFVSGGSRNGYQLRSVKTALKAKLGGKLKLYCTGDKRCVHERKIIFENIIITIDNSRTNLSLTEPTWEIFISYDELKSKAWIAKRNKFFEVSN